MNLVFEVLARPESERPQVGVPEQISNQLQRLRLLRTFTSVTDAGNSRGRSWIGLSMRADGSHQVLLLGSACHRVARVFKAMPLPSLLI